MIRSGKVEQAEIFFVCVFPKAGRSLKHPSNDTRYRSYCWEELQSSVFSTRQAGRSGHRGREATYRLSCGTFCGSWTGSQGAQALGSSFLSASVRAFPHRLTLE